VINDLNDRYSICKHNLELQGPVNTVEEAASLDDAEKKPHKELSAKGLRLKQGQHTMHSAAGTAAPSFVCLMTA